MAIQSDATTKSTIQFQALTESTNPNDTDILVIEDTTETKKIKFLNLFNKIKSKLNLATIATSGKLADTVKDANNRTTTDAEKEKWNGYEEEILSLNHNMQRADADIGNKVVFGGTKNAMFVVTEGTLTFNSSGIATLDLSSIAKAYGKTIGSAIAHIEIAGSTVITSTNVADNVVSTRAYNVASSAAFTGQLKCMIYLVLK